MKHFFYFMTVAITMIFAACEDVPVNDPPEDDSNNNSADNKPLVIDASDVVNSNNDIVAVRVLLKYYDNDAQEYKEHEIAATEYESDGFKITIPAIPDKYLTSVSNADYFPYRLARFQTAKIANVSFYAYDSTEKCIGSFYLLDDRYYLTDHIRYYSSYIYTDRSFTIRGIDDDIIYDCSFHEGWNSEYRMSESSYYEIVTEKHPNAAHKWYYRNN